MQVIKEEAEDAGKAVQPQDKEEDVAGEEHAKEDTVEDAEEMVGTFVRVHGECTTR